MDKDISNVLIRKLIKESSKMVSFMVKAPFQFKVVLIVFLGSLKKAYHNINQINICLKSLALKKKKTTQKPLVKKTQKRVAHQLRKQKEQVTQLR